MLAKGFLQQRHQLDDPPVHGRVIDRDAVFPNHLFEITQTKRIRHVPAHTSQNHVQREVQPFHHFRYPGSNVLREIRSFFIGASSGLFIQKFYLTSLSRQMV